MIEYMNGCHTISLVMLKKRKGDFSTQFKGKLQHESAKNQAQDLPSIDQAPFSQSRDFGR